ncbi:FAD-dependent oxidoreductase [Haloechinothrix sp. LS1_15]|uniref:NAD(P)/FAD-dependent oxidoreductase n=1 Tax=Haloechinothrix sp. LS1_15 TaxID=2652248 RepID=UPI0029488FAE|nr:FAD-dependent oxidoreductase [Haloechinothrix sp. LS1_15]MDV6011639.1 NAD(P)/FAD-dependent oxidoreductase [Haloechinothrix sp. LS1_15]
MARTVVVVGHGMVGHRLAEEISSRDRDGTWRTVLLTDEARPAYDRVTLSSYLHGSSADELRLAGERFSANPNVEVRRRTRVAGIDRDACRVITEGGERIGYDALVLATGARPIVPPVAGAGAGGCFVYRTLDDLEAIRQTATPGGAGVVVGGGLLGLEAANALRILGMRVSVVERAPWLLPLQVDRRGGALLRRLVAERGIEAHCGTELAAIEAGDDGRVRGVVTTAGECLPAELVIFSVGVSPRDELARAAGLAVAEGGGILVDDRCRTGDPRIWAVGDCAAVNGRCYPLVAPGYRMAETVAQQLLGDRGRAFPGADTSTRLKMLGVEVASFGDAHAETDGAVELSYATEGSYAKLVLGPDTRTLLGGVLAGDASAYPVLHPLVGHELPAQPERLLASR